MNSKKVVIYKPGRGASAETNTDKHLDLILSASRTVRKMSVVYAPQSKISLMVAHAEEYSHHVSFFTSCSSLTERRPDWSKEHMVVET